MGNTEYSGFLSWVEKAQRALLTFLMVAVAVMVFIQVVLRYVFKAPLMGIEELLLFPSIWLYFIGAMNASLERSQIVARVLEVFLKKEKTIYLVRSIASIISLIVSLWLSYWGWDFLKYSMRVDKVSPTLYIPTIYADAMVFMALVVISFYTFLELIHNFDLFKKAQSSERRILS
ncbi:TRAP transporter small permease subunit [Thermovirga sp.]|uniref:TRAP transporter small permease n=1 Tax=Thermovirga sp. TaxID=2699834 RepID=UPI0025D22965|nr:TRAP transporter small permease subunit [Thermovirga sp.]